MKKSVILLCIAVVMAGCSFTDGSEDNIVSNGIKIVGETITGFFGDDALTEGESLEGERTFEENKFIGEYRANYQEYSGEEILFGGASLDSQVGDTILIKINSEVINGDFKVYWNTSNGDPVELFSQEGQYSQIIQLKGGWEYLSIEGDNLEGDVEIEVEKVAQDSMKA